MMAFANSSLKQQDAARLINPEHMRCPLEGGNCPAADPVAETGPERCVRWLDVPVRQVP